MSIKFLSDQKGGETFKRERNPPSSWWYHIIDMLKLHTNEVLASIQMAVCPHISYCISSGTSVDMHTKVFFMHS